MKCEKCKKERAKGKYYKFHYGHGKSVKSERTRYDPLMKEYEVTLVVVGSQQPWICKRCISKRVLLTLGLGAFLFLGLIIQSVNADGYLEYYNFSYRIKTLLVNLFGYTLGFQISRVVSTVWSAILSPTVTKICIVGGIIGGFLIWEWLKEIGVVGENLAIKMSKPKMPGYSLFLNSKQYKKYMGDKDAEADERFESLIQALRRKRLFGTQTKWDTAKELGEIGDARAIEPLVDALEDKHILVRVEAAKALGKIGDTRAVEPLIEVLQSLAGPASEALGRIGDPMAVEPLIEILRHPQPLIQVSAAEALGEIGDARALDPLAQVIEDGKPFVREAAENAIEKIKSNKH
jgi:hypothetical protein